MCFGSSPMRSALPAFLFVKTYVEVARVVYTRLVRAARQCGRRDAALALSVETYVTELGSCFDLIELLGEALVPDLGQGAWEPPCPLVGPTLDSGGEAQGGRRRLQRSADGEGW